MNFREWYDDADMPEKVDGVWVDLETGIPYKPTAPSSSSRTALSAKTQDARALAKSFGGKALTGTAKQKEWGEQIRAEKLKGMTAEAAELICDLNGLCNGSKFWIENRTKTALQFERFIIDQKKWLNRHKYLRAKNTIQPLDEAEKEELADIAEKYNKLIKEWNIK